MNTRRDVKRDSGALEKQIDDVLTYMSLAAPERAQTSSKLDFADLSYFDGAEPQFEAFDESKAAASGRKHERLPEGVEELLSERPYDVIRHAVEREGLDGLRGLLRPLDYAVVKKANADWGADGASTPRYVLVRARQVSLKQARGKLARDCQIAVRITTASVLENGSMSHAIHDHIGWSMGRWWPGRGCFYSREQPGASDVVNDNVELFQCRVYEVRLASIAQREADRQWRVLLGWEGHPRMSFVTSAVGVREVFRLRDIPNGKQRRAALRHWVSSHWRETSDPDVDLKIRAHLRGAVAFTWNGLACKIIPAIEERQANRERLDICDPTQADDATIARLFGADAMAVDPEQPRALGQTRADLPAPRRYKDAGVEIHNVARSDDEPAVAAEEERA